MLPSLTAYPDMAVVSLHIHWMFVGTMFVGAILFTFWALRSLKAEPLRRLSFWLLALGILGTLLSAPFSLIGMHLRSGWGMGWMMKDGESLRLIERLIKDNDGKAVPKPMIGR